MNAVPIKIDDLPEEILLEILSYLSVEDLALRVQFVSSRWFQLCSAEILWKHSSFSAECNWSDDYVLSVLERMPKLKQFEITKPSAEILQKVAECCKDLAVLMCNFSELFEYEDAFASIFRQCTKLETLQIPAGALANQQLAALVGQLSNLRAIFLTGSSDQPVRLKDISKGCPSLVCLDLRSSSWLYSQIKYFLDKKRSRLVYLGISHESAERKSVYPLLTICEPVLRTLRLRHPCTGYSTLPFTAMSSITKLSGLKSLAICDVDAPEDILVNIFADGKLSQLSELEINLCCKVEKTFINVVCNNCPNLSRFVLDSCNNLVDEGLKYLYRCTNLTHLDLQYCVSLTDAVMDHVVKCTKLKSLCLEGCNLTDNWFYRLLELSQLRDLDLSGCYVAELPLNLFHLHLRELKKLTVNLFSNTDEAALSHLIAKMPDLQIILRDQCILDSLPD